MRFRLLTAFTLFCVLLQAQDRLYMNNGRVKRCNVQRVTPEYIYYADSTQTDSIPFFSVLLIEYRNGSAEVLNLPSSDLEYDPLVPHADPFATDFSKKYNSNYVSCNTLALSNADVSVFYEYRPKGKQFSFGMMGSYNFNLSTTFQNSFIRILHNSKKNYDLGVLINFYPTDVSADLQVYFGVMMKYTDFHFSEADTDTSGGQNIVSYTPARGSQLATLFTAGTNTFLNDRIFIRSIAGLGGFKLKGVYREQFNQEVNGDRKPEEQVHYNFLPKLYLGLMIGFNF